MSDIKQKLKDDIANISWQEIIPHAKRDAVVVIDSQLDILEVAEAIALDKTSQVSDWIGKQLVAKPSAEQLADWNENPTKEFVTAIVQPFVIIQSL